MAESSAKKTGAIILCLALLTASIAWAAWSHSQLQQSPDLVLQIIDGRNIDLAEISERPVLITFWATTCQTCVRKTPELIALYQKFQSRGVEMIAVAMAYDPPNRILDFSRRNNIPYPIALDLDGTVARAFNDVRLTPTTILIAPGGKIVFSETGNISFKNLDEKISALLAKQELDPEIQSSRTAAG